MKNQTSAPAELITEGQIGKIQEFLSAALRKQRSEFPTATVQEVIEQHGAEMQIGFLAVVRSFMEQRLGIIRRQATVNRDRTPQQALDATGRRQYTDSSVMATMPRGGSGTETVTVEFFNLGRFASDDEVDRELEKRHLVSDPYAVNAVNEADPTFADKYPNSTHWKDANGKWCFAAFYRCVGERYVSVSRYGDDWGGSWWFGGVRKLSV